MAIELHGVRADGISAGSNVTYLGVSVGQIDDVNRSEHEWILDQVAQRKNVESLNTLRRAKDVAERRT